MFNSSHPKDCDSDDNLSIVVNEVSVNDILMGRGASIDKNEGNKRFRELVRQHKIEYMSTSRQRRKQEIAMKIMNEIKSRGGRFLKQIENQDNSNTLKASESAPVWCYVKENVATRKIKQILRGSEKRSHRNRMEDLSVSHNNIVTEISQRNNQIYGVGNDSLNDRLQTYRSMEALVTQHSSNLHAPVDTMEFSSSSISDRSNILESSGATQITSSNQSIQFLQELQQFQNQLLLSQRMLEDRTHYQTESSIENLCNLLQPQIQTSERNRNLNLENMYRDVLLNTHQALGISASVPSYPTSSARRLTFQEQMLQAMNNTLEDQRSSFYVTRLLHEQNQELLSYSHLEARAHHMILDVMARSNSIRQLSTRSDIDVTSEVLDSSNIINSGHVLTRQYIQRVANQLDNDSHPVESQGEILRENVEEQVDDRQKEEAVEDLKMSKQLKSSPTSSSSSSSRKKKRHRSSRQGRIFDH